MVIQPFQNCHTKKKKEPDLLIEKVGTFGLIVLSVCTNRFNRSTKIENDAFGVVENDM